MSHVIVMIQVDLLSESMVCFGLVAEIDLALPIHVTGTLTDTYALPL
jgi:hypothetical protein